MENKIRVHRVGSLTAGISLIVFGVLFLLHIFTGIIGYTMIFRLWPFVIIGMGVELLIANCFFTKFKYDKGAVFLLVVLLLLASAMAGADLFFSHYAGEIPYII